MKMHIFLMPYIYTYLSKKVEATKHVDVFTIIIYYYSSSCIFWKNEYQMYEIFQLSIITKPSFVSQLCLVSRFKMLTASSPSLPFIILLRLTTLHINNMKNFLGPKYVRSYWKECSWNSILRFTIWFQSLIISYPKHLKLVSYNHINHKVIAEYLFKYKLIIAKQPTHTSSIFYNKMMMIRTADSSSHSSSPTLNPFRYWGRALVLL